MEQKSVTDRVFQILGIIFRVVGWVLRQAWALLSRLVTTLRESGQAGKLADRARQVATEAGEKAQTVIGDVRQQVPGGASAEDATLAGDLRQQAKVTPGMTDAIEFPGVERFAEAAEEVMTTGPASTSTGIPTTSREQFRAGDAAITIGGTEEEREEREDAAGGTIGQRPEEMGISRRSGRVVDEAAFAYGGDQNAPIPESSYETTERAAADTQAEDASAATEEDAVADAIQASISDSDVDTASYEDVPEMTNVARDPAQDTWERTSDEEQDPTRVSRDMDASVDPSGEIVDQGEPWTASSASDLDMPAASRGARMYGEEDEVAGLSAETGEGFGREEDDLLTTGGEIDLANDEMPAVEAAPAPDIVSLEEADEEGEVAFGGEDTTLVEDTLGLRESEDEPVQAGRNDDVSLRIQTGGPYEEARGADLSLSDDSDATDEDEDTEVGAGGDAGDDALSISKPGEIDLGISGDAEKAEEVQTIPAVPEDAEAGKKGATGSGPDAEESGQSDTTQATARGAAAGQANVPQGAVLGDGSATCPADHPIKGNANSRIYHLPGQSSYDQTVPEYCFATEEDAQAAGFRPRKG